MTNPREPKNVVVCHLTSVHPPFDTRIFVKECCTLAQAGYEVYLVAPGQERVERNGVIIIPVKQFTNRLARISSTIRILKIALHIRAHVYHFHDPELIPCGFLLKLLGKKVIYDVHEDHPRDMLLKEYLPAPIRPVLCFATKLIEDVANAFLDQVIPATPKIARRFSHKKRALVQNFPLCAELSGSNVPFYERRNVIAYVGLLTRIRGIREMVSAIQLVDPNLDAKLRLAGNFDDPAFEEELKNSAGWSRTEFLGHLDRSEVRNLLASSRIGMLTLHPGPTHTDSLPTKLFEYMSAGIPVIASDIPLWREIVTDAQCGILVNPYDSKEVAQAIVALLRDPKLAEQMGRSGLAAVHHKYNWETQAPVLLSAYSELTKDCYA